VASSVAGVLALGIYGLLPPSDPLYHSQKLSYWLQGYDGRIDSHNTSGSTVVTPKDADEAVRQLGDKAMPTLLRMLSENDSKAMLKFLELAQRQHYITFRHVPAERLNAEAAWGFMALGPKGSNAVPGLVRIYKKKISPDSISRTAASLGYIGRPASNAVPVLLRAVDDRDGEVRRGAIFALGQIRAEPAEVVPALIASLQDPYSSRGSPNRVLAAQALGGYGVQAKPAVPALLQMANDPREFLASFTAEQSLKSIDPGAVARVNPRGLKPGY
jgi:HEAT repeat protein